MSELNKKYSHRHSKVLFNEEDIKYLEKLMGSNKSAELAIIYIKVTKAKEQQDKRRESSRLSKQRHKEEISIRRKEAYRNKKLEQHTA